MSIAGRLAIGTCAVGLLVLLLLTSGPSEPVPGGTIVLIILGTAVIGMVAGRLIARPLLQLGAAARAIAAGSPPRFPRSKIPEIDGLAQGIREMHVELSKRIDELAREKAASTAIVDAMGEGIIGSDGSGKIVIANAAARELLSYGPDDQLPALQTLFRAKEAQEAVSDVLLGKTVHDREVERDGRTLAINARPVGSDGAVLVLRDLTAVRHLEAVRRDFVANVSHELKTPLTSIAGYAETIADDSIAEEDRRRFLATIRSNAARMQALVDDLLDLSRIESGSWSPQPEVIELEAAAQDAWWLVADRANERDVNFNTNIPAEVSQLHADANALRQIMGNLFDNAIRYTEPGGNIEFSAERVDGHVEISVSDDGAGIPSEHLPRIFERFYRVDPSRSREEGGTGLGLSIVRHMVEAHGGSARVESTLRAGTRVTCSFPEPPQAH